MKIPLWKPRKVKTPKPGRTPAEHRAAVRAVVAGRVTVDLSSPARPGRALSKAEFRAELRRLGFETYAAYLWSPLWLGIRKRVLERAHGRCEDCGARARQVHHQTYTRENLAGRSDLELLALCDGCHERRHRRR